MTFHKIIDTIVGGPICTGFIIFAIIGTIISVLFGDWGGILFGLIMFIIIVVLVIGLLINDH